MGCWPFMDPQTSAEDLAKVTEDKKKIAKLLIINTVGDLYLPAIQNMNGREAWAALESLFSSNNAFTRMGIVDEFFGLERHHKESTRSDQSHWHRSSAHQPWPEGRD
jgi:alpha-acetolactate decarboxylase